MGAAGAFKLYAIMCIIVIILPFITDQAAAFYVQRVGRERMELAIDVGVVEAEYDVDATNGGIVQMDDQVLESAVRREFAKQMKLDLITMGNSYMKNSNFSAELKYDSFKKPYIEVQFSTHMRLLMPGEGKTLTVKRKVPYETIYN